MKYLILLSLLIFLQFVSSSRILVVFPAPARSHYILGNVIARGLAEAGHDVTMVSPFEDPNPPEKGSYVNVVLDGLYEEEQKQPENLSILDLEQMNSFWFIWFTNLFGNELTKNTLDHSNFTRILKLQEHFDVIIIEQFVNDALKALSYHFKAPLIIFSTMGANSWINPLVGNPSPPSYIPEILLGYTHNMSFFKKLVNLLFLTLSELNRELIFIPNQNKLVQEYFPGAPNLDVLLYNISLVFLNSHESVNQAVPHVPNMIDVGGFHLKHPKELPQNLKEFMQNATEGVVYFSLGSNLPSSAIPQKQMKIIITALGKLKQKVLWKWDKDTFEEKPDNVIFAKWFPQSDILAHPNTKLFITHAGLLSITETIYHGIPILALPVFADQKLNAARSVMDGYGLSMSLSEISEEKFTFALNDLLNDQKYRNSAQRRSLLMHDRPVKPMDLIVYWTEYVIRNQGAPHLKVAGLDLPLYKYLLLDVISFLIFTIIILIVVICIVIKRMCSKNNGKSINKQKIKKN